MTGATILAVRLDSDGTARCRREWFRLEVAGAGSGYSSASSSAFLEENSSSVTSPA